MVLALLVRASVSAPRPVFPGSSLLVTRRVGRREFRLRPSKKVNQIILYIIAVVAKRYGISLHALCAMSNHLHDVFTDPEARAPEFSCLAHSLIGRHLNCTFGDFENLWSTQQTNQVECIEPDDTIAKIAYTMANPVEAGLVRFGKSWPGVRLCWPHPPITIERPKGFFRDESEGGTMPKTVQLEFQRPAGYDDYSDEELAVLIQQAIDDREDMFRAQFDREGKRFLGRRAILRQSRYDSPKTVAPHFGIAPRVAAKDKWRRIETLQRNRKWHSDYQDKRKRWLRGERDVVFPYGTYQLRVQYGVICAPRPST
jgi:putative transposase